MHNIQADEGPGTAKTCFAVNSNSLITAYVAVSKRNKITDDSILWAGAIWILHFVNLDRVARKTRSIIKLFVEPDDSLDVHIQELIDQVIRSYISAET